MNRNELVDRCKVIIQEAYEEATEMIVAYLELHSKEQLQPLCKEIDPENWNALRSRVQRAQKARKAASGTGSERTTSPEWKKVDRRSTKRTLRQEPEIVAELTPSEQRALAQALNRESIKRQREAEHVSKKKEREHLGDEVVDGLELAQALQDAEFFLIKARGDLAGFVKALGKIGVENTPEDWRERCLDWVDDNEGHLGMAKALLAGDNIDWTAFDELLSKEG